MTNDTTTASRIKLLEKESRSTKKKIDAMDKSQTGISSSLKSLAESQALMSEILAGISNMLGSFKEFEIRTSIEKLSESEHRDRIDKRIDSAESNHASLKNKIDADLDKVYSCIRKIDKALAVKTGTDDIKQTGLQRTFEVRGERVYKGLFWLMTGMASLLFVFLSKG